ncbi:MAG: ABC transporter permease [Anaerolineales bacterium]|nr:ABC transporter permease [Anaerolineales bacterium]
MTGRITIIISSFWVVAVILLAIFGPLAAPADPFSPVGEPLLSPLEHGPMGTDALGRDLWSRILYGARQSLSAALLATTLTVSIGTTLGLIAVLYTSWLGGIILTLANAALAIPGLLLAMLFVAAMGPGYLTVILAIGLGGAPGFIRLSRSIFAQIADEGYVDVARALGAGKLRIARNHILLNAQGPLLSLATTHFAWAFMGITTLTFLGLAGDPSIPEWGVIMNSGRAFLIDAPWLAVVPGALISLTILAVHHLGLELTDRFRPRG